MFPQCSPLFSPLTSSAVSCPLLRRRTGRWTETLRKPRRESRSPQPSKTLSKETRTYWWVCLVCVGLSAWMCSRRGLECYAQPFPLSVLTSRRGETHTNTHTFCEGAVRFLGSKKIRKEVLETSRQNRLRNWINKKNLNLCFFWFSFQNSYLTRLEEIRDTLEISPFFKTHEVKTQVEQRTETFQQDAVHSGDLRPLHAGYLINKWRNIAKCSKESSSRWLWDTRKRNNTKHLRGHSVYDLLRSGRVSNPHRRLESVRQLVSDVF